jgi:ribosomal protein L7/L12
MGDGIRTKLRLVGFQEGAKTITAIKAIRSHLGINLKDAKDMVESCIKGESIVLHTKSETAAAALESELKEALFITKRLPDDNGSTV